MERVAGIEPASSAWKAEVLPLNYTRRNRVPSLNSNPLPLQKTFLYTRPFTLVVEGEGFEPSKAKPSDLQSDPFDHSGTPPDNAKNRPVPRFRNTPTIHPSKPINILLLLSLQFLTNKPCRTPLVPPQGVEPWTFSLQVSCSTS